MSTIAQNLEALQQAKSDIAEAITDMGGTVQSGDGLSDFAGAIMTIPAGGGNLEAKTVALDMSSGDQEVEASAGYDGLSKVTVTRPATLIHENIKDGVTIGGVTGTFVGTPITNNLDGLVDGSITSFTMPQGKTLVKSYLFQSNTALQSADLTGATMIGDYAFNGCSNAGINLPSTLTSIGNYAFQRAGRTPMILETVNNCGVGNYAFYLANIGKVKGRFGSIGSYAFSISNSSVSLTEVDIVCNGNIGSYAFVGYQSTAQNGTITKLHMQVNGGIGTYAFGSQGYVADLSISGNISSLSTNAFDGMGKFRANPASNILMFDFRNSTFTSIGTSALYGITYSTIYIPTTCTSIGSSGLSYVTNSNVYFLSSTPPTAQSNSFSSSSNTIWWVPYNSANDYRTKTNWAAIAANVQGYAAENTFQNGEILPIINEEGYGLTWYSDIAMTNQVTTVSDATQKLYCAVGTTVLAYRITKVTTMDCSVVISDGTNNYAEGDMILAGTVVTITGVPDTAGWTPYIFEVNGVTFTSGDTFTVNTSIEITAIYWDGEHIPISSNLADNSWAMIKRGCQLGLASSLWSLLDGKTLTLTDGRTYTCRIVDMKAGRFVYADGTSGSTHCMFETVECVNANGITTFAMNSSSTSAGGFAASRMKTVHLDQTIYNLLPSDLKDVLSEVVVYSSNGTQSTMVAANCKLFIKSVHETFSSGTANSYARDDTNGFGRLEAYEANDTAAFRQKHVVGTTTNVVNWLRSPSRSYSGLFCNVNSKGAVGDNDANNLLRVAFCFAF